MINYNILDSNTFIGQSGKREVMHFETSEELLGDMKYYNISEALVTHFMSKEYYPSQGNSLLLSQIKNFKNLNPCWVLPCYQRPDEEKISKTIEDMLSLGIRIVRIYPPNRTPDLIEPWMGYEVFKILESHRIPVLLSESDMGSWPDKKHDGFKTKMVYELCKSFPKLPIIIVKFNYQLILAAFSIMEECKNFHIEISNYTTHRGVELVVNKFGSNRVIYGSGMPLQNPGSSISILRYAKITEIEKKDIAGNNLRNLMNEVI